jgi:choline dehydrogenase-like flavoprotein
MIYTRGHRKDYDDYAAAGNTGRSYNEILPYFLKSENNTVPEYYASPYHAHDGYLNVERVRYKSTLVDAFLKGGQELGYKIIDYTEPTQHGFSRIQATQKRGRRVSAAKAFLKSVKYRRNLHVSILTRVTKVLIDPKTKNAYGVEYSKNYRRRIAFARKEVILSAGAINSPQLLMLSGVGPKEHLTQMGIPVIQDLNVGENMYEHYSYVGLMFLVNKTNSALKVNRLNLPVFLDWLNNGRGLLTLPGGVEGLGYVNSKYNRPTPYDDRADIELIFAGASFSSDNGGDFKASYGITDCMYQQHFSYGNNKDTWTIIPMLLHPRSKGRVQLRNKNPWSSPKVFFNYFEDEYDMKVLIDAINQIMELSETKAFQQLGTRLSPSTLPQCLKYPYKSDEYWGCMLRYFTGTLHHQSGTCKMGPSTDSTAVVDPELRVYGITNLRVVDASIFPKIPGAHLYAPTLMVGEKASDMIKKTWYERPETSYQNTGSPYEAYLHTSVAPCLNETTNFTIPTNNDETYQKLSNR